MNQTHEDWVLQKLTHGSMRYVARGNQRSIVKARAAKIAAEFATEFPTACKRGGKNPLVGCAEIFAIWRNRDVEKASPTETAACKALAERRAAAEKATEAELTTKRQSMIDEANQIITNSQRLSSQISIHQHDDEEAAEDFFAQAGSLYDKIRHHITHGPLFAECRTANDSLHALRTLLRSKCQSCSWAKQSIPGPSSSSSSGAAAQPQQGGIPGETLQIPTNSKFGVHNRVLNDTLKSLEKKVKKTVEKFDEVDKLRNNQSGVVMQRNDVERSILNSALEANRKEEIVRSIELQTTQLVKSFRELASLSPLGAALGTSFFVGQSGLSPAYIRAHTLTPNLEDYDDLTAGLVFSVQQSIFDAGCVNEELRAKTVASKAKKEIGGQHFNKVKYELHTPVSGAGAGAGAGAAIVEDIFGDGDSDVDDISCSNGITCSCGCKASCAPSAGVRAEHYCSICRGPVFAQYCFYDEEGQGTRPCKAPRCAAAAAASSATVGKN
jgi:hypothetical protein